MLSKSSLRLQVGGFGLKIRRCWGFAPRGVNLVSSSLVAALASLKS